MDHKHHPHMHETMATTTHACCQEKKAAAWVANRRRSVGRNGSCQHAKQGQLTVLLADSLLVAAFCTALIAASS
jgi:hypothetical protein